VAERRLRDIIELALSSGRNTVWSGDDFTVVDWRRHARAVAKHLVGDDYLLVTYA
jgi:hypothetical protein